MSLLKQKVYIKRKAIAPHGNTGYYSHLKLAEVLAVSTVTIVSFLFFLGAIPVPDDTFVPHKGVCQHESN